MDTLEMLIAICDRRRRKEFQETLQRHQVLLTQTVLCRGTASSEILNYLSLEQSDKAMIIAVVSSATLPKLMRDFRHEQSIDIPGNGIVATIPLNRIAGQRTLSLLTYQQAYERPRETEEGTMLAVDHELIVVIANEGYADVVMDAARRAGAGGGTALHAKGTGAEYAKKFFGVTLAGEKELILIVSPTPKRDEIMRAIVADAGPNSRARGIVFSLPVSSVAGLRTEED